MTSLIIREPRGIINTPTAAAAPVTLSDLVSQQFAVMLDEWNDGMRLDRELQNSRARAFWRAQRRMTLADLMDILGIRYGTTLETLGQL